MMFRTLWGSGWGRIVLFSLLATILGMVGYRILNRPLIIAYVGRYMPRLERPDSTIEIRDRLDRFNEEVLRSLLVKYNRESGHRRLKLLTFATGEDPESADSIYRHELLPRSDVILVIDNTWGEQLSGAAGAIRGSDLPVISINADLGEVDYGRNVIFLGHGEQDAAGVTNFVANVLQNKNPVVFVTEEFLGGKPYWLTRRFLDLFGQVGVVVSDTLYVPGSAVTSPDSARLMNDLAELAQTAGPKTIVINTHALWGNAILAHADSLFSNSHFVGGAYIASRCGIQPMGAGKNEVIIHTTPTDAVAEDVFLTLRDLDRMDDECDLVTLFALFTKRNLDVVELLSLAIHERPDSVSVTRSLLLEFLESLPGSTLTTPREIYRFDSLGRVMRETTFELRTADFVGSYPYQLNREGRRIPNITFGIELIEISNIDVLDNTFSADFYHWLRVDGVESLTESLFHFRNMKDPGQKILVVERSVGKTQYQLYKTSGAVFHQAYELKKFPRDRQALTITAEITSPSDSFRVSFENASVSDRCTGIETVAIGAWVIRDCFVTVDNQITTSKRGDPSLDPSEAQQFKVLNVRLEVDRKFLQPFITIFLPLLLIGLAAVSLLYINDLSFATLGDMSVGVFLSIVTYAIAYGKMTPQVGVLTTADILFYATFGVVLASFIGLVYHNSQRKDHKLRDKYLRHLRIALSGSYALIIVWIILR